MPLSQQLDSTSESYVNFIQSLPNLSISQYDYHGKSLSIATTTMSTKFTLSSTVHLNSGYTMPLLGFGAAHCDEASILEALKAGYRSVNIVHSEHSSYP